MTNSQIPVNALDRHISPLARELGAAAMAVIDSGYYVLGPNVQAFEQAFARWCGVRDCIGVANGTDALELGLRSMGIASGSVVAVAANAAMYGTTAVLVCGAEPVFVDIDATSFNMDPSALDRVAAGRRIDAVIVTHLYGRLADMDAILALSRTHGFEVFEDCAQATARVILPAVAGSFGKAASFSFYPTKNLGALGDGGAVVTNDPNREDAAQAPPVRWSSSTPTRCPGPDSRLDELQAPSWA